MLFYGNILFLIISSVWSDEGPIVKTNLGWIKGFYVTSALGKKYQAFEGIPYAKPPIGSLRFEPPEALIPWVGIWSATVQPTGCTAFDIFQGPEDAVQGVEDCLYLNLYTPTNRSEVLLPTIVFIHPGPLHFKPVKQSGPKYIIDRNVVYIEINFRLGPLGFLSTEDDIVPGNMGLKDQAMALKWISENIKYFGGDPKKVMLVGGSGGGACIHYHYLSRLSAGLFHSGMSLSVTALSTSLQTTKHLENAKILAKSIGCPSHDVRQMVDCLKSRPAKTITSALFEFTFWLGFLFFAPFNVVVEKPGKNAFLDRSPIDILKSGDVYDAPWIVGSVAGDGIFPAGVFFLNDTIMKSLNDNWETIILKVLKMDETIPENRQSEVAKKIKQHYFGSEPVSTTNKEILQKLCEQAIYKSDIEKSVKLMAKANRSPVWLYNYDYRATGSFSTFITKTNINLGPAHQDDTILVLDIVPVQDSVTESSDLAVQRNLLDIWVSMADKGMPEVSNVTWLPINPYEDNLQYLYINGSGNYILNGSSYFADSTFWETLPIKESLI